MLVFVSRLIRMVWFTKSVSFSMLLAVPPPDSTIWVNRKKQIL